MPDYDSQQFTPPAPLASVILRTRDRAKSVSDVTMLIDSGADVTLLPKTCTDQLALRSEPEGAFVLRGFGGGTSLAKTVDAELLFLGRVFRGRFLVIDQEFGILGRNVLNHVSLLLDGPRLNWRDGAY